VRDFLGKTFLLPGKVSNVVDQQIQVEVHGIAAGPLVLRQSNVVSSANGALTAGQGVMVAIRPEQVSILGTTADGRPNTIQANLQAVLFLGDRYEYTVEIGSETRVLVSPASQQVKRGDKIFLELNPEGMTLWPRE
jgi:ABC-type Fe3+/spermidine/putrescine transport system ATPase subunit